MSTITPAPTIRAHTEALLEAALLAGAITPEERQKVAALWEETSLCQRVGNTITKPGFFEREAESINIVSVAYAVKELSDALEQTKQWVAERDRRDPLCGFGRADEYSDHALKNFMPKWFAAWLKEHRWHPVGMLRGEESWWRYAQAFGVTQSAWWQQAKPHIIALRGT